MPGKRRVSAIRQPRDRNAHDVFHGRNTVLRKPTSKELDLFLLAGCSCLLTLLYHPVANALQVHSAQNSSAAVTTQASTPSQNTMNAFHLTLPSREDVKEEEAEG